MISPTAHAGGMPAASATFRILPLIAQSPAAATRSLLTRVFTLAMLTFLAACGGGGGGDGASGGENDGGDTGGGGQPAPGPVTISGKAQYEFPPPEQACQGLDFNSLQVRPIRRATIQLVDAATDAVLDAGVTDEQGDFALTADPRTEVFIRVRAELKKTGTPSWDVEVRDNTATGPATGTPPPLGARALYVLDGAAFNSGTADMTRDITAATGWTGTAYTGTRAAAPFAILDTIYAGMSLVAAAEPTVSFEPLDVFWSVNNTASGADIDIDTGELGTSFYRSDNKLFLLGKAGTDADEFDDHVVAHEWGHYFEDTFSRSDSIGGTHSVGDQLDMRVAFGEGWATALSGMALDNPTYCDTFGSRGFRINIEGEGAGTPGWFNEISVMKLVYDLWDTAIDGVDTASIGFAPIYNVMIGAQAATPAFTSIFTFASALKTENPADVPFIDGLLEAEDITANDAFGDGETNGGDGDLSDVLPVYTTITPDGTTVNVCSNSQHDRDSSGLVADGNKLSEHRFMRMTIDTPSRYTFNITTTTQIPWPDDPADDSDQSDPDIRILLNGQSQNAFVDSDGDGQLDEQGFSGAANEEIITTPEPLAAGDYVMDLNEFRYQDDETPADYPARTCFDVTVTAAQ